MFFAGKKTVYLSLYCEEQKSRSAGFMQLLCGYDKIKMIIQTRDVKEVPDKLCDVAVCTKETMIQVGSIAVKEGKGFFEKEFRTSNSSIIINQIEVPWKEITAVQISLTEKEKICGYLIREKGAVSQESSGVDGRRIAEEKPKEELLQSCDIMIREEPVYADKWEQIVKQYSNVHPFKDDRVFVSLQLQDLIILPEKDRKLIHNSFLLHGFYNYRHLILGKDYRLGNCMEKCFYLGVPGVFFEREKQVAVMFGFEGFECAGAVETGKFGYYVREVSI